MSDVKRFYAPGLDCLYRSNKDAPRELIPLVLESDYAKLEAEAQALREQNTKFQHMLADVVAKHFAENIKRSTAQKSMDVYLSEGIRLLEEEVADARRDAERHELRANQYSEELAVLCARVVVVPERKDMAHGFDGKRTYAMAWNACLDELARLNGKAVSEGLLRSLLSQDLNKVMAAQSVLSELLGEGKEHD